MQKILLITQIIISAALMASVLLQKRGASLGSAFGGAGGVYYQKRGIEKILFYLTIILFILFLGVASIILWIS